MKKLYTFYAYFIILLASGLSIISCKDDDEDPMPFYSLDEDPLGQSYEEWMIEWWQFLMSHDCASFPNAAAETQSGPVHFLSGAIDTYTKNITITSDKAIFTPIINYINDYPCPDTSFHPAPGQSLEDFLLEGAAGFIDLGEDLEIILDGQVVTITEAYRMHTGLFYFTGHPDIANCFDPCVTGESQAAVSDGYWIMIKPLSKGQHTLVVKSSIPAIPLTGNGTFNITVI